MEHKINYIKAHKVIQLLTKNDIELRPIHKSMIDAIFMYWNLKEWVELFNVDRDSLMEYSKISNRKTYYETLSFLQERDYIIYRPSKNPDIASVFGMGKKVTSAITSDGSCDITSAGSSAGSSGGTIYINIKTIKPNILKLINDNIELVENNLETWIGSEFNSGKFNSSKFLKSMGADSNLIKEWFSVRKLKKLSNTQTAMNDFMEEVKKSNMPINDVLKKCIIKSWGGFKYSWVLNEHKTTLDQKMQSSTPTVLPQRQQSQILEPTEQEKLAFRKANGLL